MSEARVPRSARPASIRRALIGAILGSALYGLATAPAAAAPMILALTDTPYVASFFIAESLGYFADEKLSLKLLRCSLGRVCLDHLLAGKAQFATAADTPIAIAALAKEGFAIVATTTTSGHEFKIVVRHDRGIRSAADLKGRRISIRKGTSSHYFMETFLVFHGLRPSDVSLIDTSPDDVAGPLIRGEVDASGMSFTSASEAVQRLGDAVRLLSVPNFLTITYNLVAAPASAGVSDDDVFKLLRALQRANVVIRDNPDRARAIVAAAIKIAPLLLGETWSEYDFRLQLGQPLVTTLEAQVRWALREGLAAEGAPLPDMLDYIRPEPLRRLDPRAVRLVK